MLDELAKSIVFRTVGAQDRRVRPQIADQETGDALLRFQAGDLDRHDLAFAGRKLAEKAFDFTLPGQALDERGRRGTVTEQILNRSTEQIGRVRSREQAQQRGTHGLDLSSALLREGQDSQRAPQRAVGRQFRQQGQGEGPPQSN